MRRYNQTRTTIFCAAVIMAFLLTPLLAAAQPAINIYTDKGDYASQGTVEVSLAAANPNDPVVVDVYVGLLTSSGELFSLRADGWATGAGPWMERTYLPPGFVLERTPLWWFNISCEMPPIGQPGQYSFAAVLTEPGTLDWVSGLSLAPFTVGTPSDYYVDAETGNDSNNGTEGAPWRTVTHALASVRGSAADPVTLHVAAGTYAASSNGEAFPLKVKSHVSLLGEGADLTILDAEEKAYHVIYCYGVSELTIEGFTMKGGAAFGKGKDSYGGGILCSGCSPTFSDNVIADNAGYYGGGICCGEGSPRILNCTIESNAAQGEGLHGGWGGGIYCDFYCSAVVSGNTIRANSADSGAGILCAQSSPLIARNTISENLGNGVCCLFEGAPQIVENMIAGNISSCGGGIDCEEGSPIIKGNVIKDNESNGVDAGLGIPAGGGGICCYGSDAMISGNLITGNKALMDGGGIYSLMGDRSVIADNLIFGNVADCGGGIEYSESSPEIFSNTVVGNSGSSRLFGGGGISGDWLSDPVSIADCIVWANGDDLYNCTATYCCIEDKDGGEGNIHGDPMFVTGPLGGHYLDPASPCINAGSRSAEDAGLSDRTTQADGTPDSGIVDMGFHYPIQ